MNERVSERKGRREFTEDRAGKQARLSPCSTAGISYIVYDVWGA